MAHLPPTHARLTPDRVRERLAVSRLAARSAERETVAVKAAVDQRLADSSACLHATADLLLDLRRRVRP